MIKLSILILTHNRPELFKRCINSVLNNKPDNVEILVNNDSDDIQEIEGAKYFYHKSEDLSDIYKMLFSEAKGEYIWFLEDDDYATSLFYKYIDYNYDINYMNYVDAYFFKNHKKPKPFKIEEENDQFQLSQILFKKSLLDIKDFPKNNILHNDWFLFQKIKNDSIKIIEKYMFIQTIDGNDNISSKNLCKDERFMSQ